MSAKNIKPGGCRSYSPVELFPPVGGGAWDCGEEFSFLNFSQLAETEGLPPQLNTSLIDFALDAATSVSDFGDVHNMLLRFGLLPAAAHALHESRDDKASNFCFPLPKREPL